MMCMSLTAHVMTDRQTDRNTDRHAVKMVDTHQPVKSKEDKGVKRRASLCPSVKVQQSLQLRHSTPPLPFSSLTVAGGWHTRHDVALLVLSTVRQERIG